MPSLTNTLFLLAGLGAGLNNAHPTARQNQISKRSGPTCSDVVIPVTIDGAENKDIPTDLVSGLTSALTSALELASIETLVNGIGDTLQNAVVNGTYDISARYCEPEVTVEGREDTIQLLVHGITYDKNYWSGGAYPEGYNGDTYSWIAYASKLGYPTLSIDRLGCGNSSHPDPTTVVQVPAQVVAYHGVIQALRNGAVGGRTFSKIAYVGHSYGSVIGNGISAKYPDDIDALVLTGYTKYLKGSALPGVAVTPVLLPASTVFDRFSDLDPGYLAMSYQAGRDSMLFTGDYDSALGDYEWPMSGTVTMGEAISSLFINDIAEDYTKPVFVITGHVDQIFCGLSMPFLGETNCGNGTSNYMAQTETLYPNAQYSYLDVPATGHDLNFHYSANTSFKAVHDFFENVAEL